MDEQQPKPKASELIQGTLTVLILKLLAMNPSMTLSGMREMTEKITLEKFQIEESDVLKNIEALQKDGVVVQDGDQWKLTEDGRTLAKQTINNFKKFLDSKL